MHKPLSSITRQRLRRYIREVATEKKPELLKLLTEIQGDMQLLTSAVLAAYFDGKGPDEQIAMLKFSFGIHPLDLEQAFEALVCSSAGQLIGPDQPFVIIGSICPETKVYGTN